MSDTHDMTETEELAALGHAAKDERVYSAIRELGTAFRIDSVKPIVKALESHHELYRRHPTATELRVGLDAPVQATLDQALGLALEIGWDTLAPVVQILAERNVVAASWGPMVQKFTHSTNQAAKKGIAAAATEHREAIESLLQMVADLAKTQDVAVGQRFRPMTERLPGITKDYRARHDRLIPTGIQYLDDVAGGGIGVNDLWIFSATTGSGKTAAMIEIGKNAAKAGKRVAFFALEADDREMEARLLFPALLNLFNEKRENRHKYVDPVKWLHGDPATHEMLAPYVAKAEAEAAKDLANLHTMYLGFGKYTARDLERHVIARSKDSDLIIIDHLGYVALDGDNETKETTDLLFLLRDLVKLGKGVPIISACHTRKSPPQAKRFAPLIPDRNDIKGAGAITQCATAVVMLSKIRTEKVFFKTDTVDAPPPPFPGATVIQLQKDRRDGRDEFAAVCSFDKKRRTYAPNYALGRLTKGDTGWEPVVAVAEAPWATNATVSLQPFGAEAPKESK